MDTVIYEVRDRIAWITLNRPEKLNAINSDMREDLFEAFEDFSGNPDAWVAIITGAGRAFSVGHDLVQMGTRIGKATSERTTDDLYLYQRRIYKPIISAINGICLAQGAGIAFCSDIRIASEKAQFGWPQVKRGISSISGPSLLSHMVPLNVAFEFLFTGEFIPIEECLKLHLVNKVVPHESVLDEAEKVARKILENAPLSVRAIKRASIEGQNHSLEERIPIARAQANICNASEDAKEGLAAFSEKRAPVWKGR